MRFRFRMWFGRGLVLAGFCGWRGFGGEGAGLRFPIRIIIKHLSPAALRNRALPLRGLLTPVMKPSRRASVSLRDGQ